MRGFLGLTTSRRRRYNRGVFKSLYILRHGRTQANVVKALVGHTHSPLLPKSLEISRQIGEFLSPVDFDVFFVSPLERAVQSYRAMNLTKVGRLIVEPRIKEINCGSCEGMADFPQDLKKCFKEDPYATPFPEGESFQMVEKRVLEFLEEIKTTCAGKTVGVLSHWSPSGIMASALMGWRFRGLRDPWLQPNNSIYKFEEGQLSYIAVGKMDEWYRGH